MRSALHGANILAAILRAAVAPPIFHVAPATTFQARTQCHGKVLLPLRRRRRTSVVLGGPGAVSLKLGTYPVANIALRRMHPDVAAAATDASGIIRVSSGARTVLSAHIRVFRLHRTESGLSFQRPALSRHQTLLPKLAPMRALVIADTDGSSSRPLRRRPFGIEIPVRRVGAGVGKVVVCRRADVAPVRQRAVAIVVAGAAGGPVYLHFFVLLVLLAVLALLVLGRKAEQRGGEPLLQGRRSARGGWRQVRQVHFRVAGGMGVHVAQPSTKVGSGDRRNRPWHPQPSRNFSAPLRTRK
mmetsp:Transcript_71017/g.197269  ORF Transcript_71017/g.197269 Transcript_71017/m.197269 type:complete len:299 (-) Transcript_71017:46-942(-)